MFTKKLSIAFVLLLLPLMGFANDKVVNVYVWANYISQDVAQQFERETGIKVQISNYDNNEILYAKLKADPKIGYDIIVPSSYYVSRMMTQHMLEKIDKTHIPNLAQINPALLNQHFDPDNTYSIPFVWATTGILVNKKYWDPKTIQTWSDLWQTRFKNQLLVIDDVREAFSMAMVRLHHSINSENPAEIKAAYEELSRLLPNIKVFNSDSLTNVYIDEDITVGMSWSGEATKAMSENPNLTYIYPKDGFWFWIDCLAIPQYAPHKKNAELFINFLLRKDISMKLMQFNGYSSPNLQTIKEAPARYRENPAINPSPQTLKRAHLQSYVGDASGIYLKYWQLLKLGGK
jgi:spermidine/putrescine transport system substrate-binding protein